MQNSELINKRVRSQNLNRIPLKQICLTASGVLAIVQMSASSAIAFTPERLYNSFERYSTTDAANGNAIDFYFPTLEDGTAVDNLPAVLLLQGALVDKSFYADYASQVAQYGFAVSVPDDLKPIAQ